MQLSFKAPCVKLDKLETIWLQLSNIACNIKCKHCYLDCHHDIKKKNFLSFDKIAEALSIKFDNLKNIYITGGEPFLHPKINDILRLALKKSNVKIYTNGTLLSEKKIKILKELDDNSPHHLSLRMSLDHFTEGRNDEYRARGVFKKVLNALTLAQKYNLPADVICVNLKNEDENLLRDGFVSLFEKRNLNLSLSDVKILPMLKLGTYAKYYHISDEEKQVTFDALNDFDIELLDCKNSRVLTINGIYCCPALINDPRGRLGDNLTSFVKNVYLETQTCVDCLNRKDKLFG